MSKLHVSIDHGGQRVEFDSPGGEGNPGIVEDDFGFSISDLNPVRHAKKAAKAVGGSTDKFVRTAANAAGHGAHTLVRVTNKVTGEVTDLARRIPVVGKPLSVAVGASFEPARLASAVASGKRIDRVVADSLGRSIRDAKALAPYAQLVASAVPGVGTGLSAGMAGGLALAEGRPINEAVVAATRAAIPGGPLATAAFDASVAVASGRSVNDAAVEAAITAAAPDPASRGRVKAALEVAKGVSSGRPLDKVALAAAAHTLPTEARNRAEAAIGKPDAQEKVYDELVATIPTSVSRAVVSGVALGFAQELQRDIHTAVTSAAGRAALAKAGAEVVAKSDVLRVASEGAPDKKAFDLGIGLMRHSGVTPPAVSYLRDTLTPRGKVSFDSALAIHVGAASNPRFSPRTQGHYKVGYYAVTGTLTTSAEQRGAIVKLMSKNVTARSGAAVAVRMVRRRRSLWRRMIEWLKRKTRSSG